jgi:hypothetical protein
MELEPHGTRARLTLAPGATVQHVMFNDPASTGTTTVQTTLRFSCTGRGVHVGQGVTYKFGGWP